jgi:hypothetical protein
MYQIKNINFRSVCFTISLLLFVFACSALCDSARVLAQAQKATPVGAADEGAPVFREYKGVALGMSADEARKKLGSPTDKSDEQDFFEVSETETAQVFYDKTKKVNAISINYLGGNSIPQPKAVLGTDVQAKPDGSIHQVVRFPKAGCWVSYNRTAGDSPLVTVTMKKID